MLLLLKNKTVELIKIIIIAVYVGRKSHIMTLISCGKNNIYIFYFVSLLLLPWQNLKIIVHPYFSFLIILVLTNARLHSKLTLPLLKVQAGSATRFQEFGQLLLHPRLLIVVQA